MNQMPPETDLEPSIAISEFRRLPICHYTHVCGMTLLGFGIGFGIKQPSLASLSALFAGLLLTLIGRYLMGKYLNVAKAAIALHDTPPATIESDDDDARS